MALSKNFYKTLVVLFTIAVLLFFSLQQYRTYQQSTITTQTQLKLRTLRSRVVLLDESLTMSARLYILTGDEKWLKQYNKFDQQYNETLAEIDKQYHAKYNGKEELQKASVHLFNLERASFEVLKKNQPEQAKSILFGKEYDQQKKFLVIGTGKLTRQIDSTVNELMLTHGAIARNNSYALIAVVLLVLLGWYAFVKFAQRAQKKIHAISLQRAEDAIASEKALQKTNSQLQLLSIHLQEVREKERKFIAYEISEELGQQLAAIKIKTDLLLTDFAGDPAAVASINEVTNSIGYALNFLRKLADDVYPGILKDLGLVEAMEWERNQVANNSQTDISFSCDVGDLEIDQQVATVLFRTYQEKIRTLVINGSNKIISVLKVLDGQIVLSIYDECQMVPRKKLIEDLAIEERLRSIKAKLQICNGAEENSFTVMVPYLAQTA